MSDLQSFKSVSSRERDSATGGNAQWKGVLLSRLIDQAIDGLTTEQRSGIDLVILKNAAGARAYVPRSLVTKYPLMLAWSRDGKSLPSPRGPFTAVVPWTSKPRILDEELPLESYQIPGVSEIELGSYKSVYGAYFLKRRTDPVAMRGEKIFVQNCLSCHAGPGRPNLANPTTTQTETIASFAHPAVKGLPKLQQKNRRAVLSYIEAHRGEASTTPVVKTGAGSSAATPPPAVSRN